MPEGVGHVWAIFWALAHAGERIDYSELEAYQRVTGNTVTPPEVEMLDAMSAEFQRYVAEKTKKAGANA